MLKGGIFGFGGVGQLKASVIRQEYDNVKIVGVYDIDKEKMDLAQKDFSLQAAESPEDLVNMDIDFIIVSSSNSAHAEHTILAARAGKHVMVEKPPCLTLEDADNMITAVEKAGVINVVDYSARFGDYHIILHEFIQNGTLGRILQFWSNVSRDFGLASAGKEHWAVQRPDLSGEWILHHLCHQIDLAYWMLGEFDDVYCQTRTTLPKTDSPETVACIANMECGAQVTLMDRVSMYRFHSLGVVGDKATVVIQGPNKEAIMEMKDEATGTVKRIPTATRSKRATDHFIKCLRNEETSKCTLKDARESVKVALAMMKSARENRVVKIG